MDVPYVITIAHQKGGVGKSTIAANLAVTLAKIYGKAFIAVDLDTQRSLSYFNSIRKNEGMDPIFIAQVKSADELLKIIKANRGVILIDAGGFDSDVNRIAMLYADRIITPVSDSPFELGGLLMFRGILRELRKARSDLQATVLLNKVHMFASGSLEEIFEFARENDEFDVFDTVLRDRGDYKKSISAGKSVEEFVADGKAADEINQLLGEINGKE